MNPLVVTARSGVVCHTGISSVISKPYCHLFSEKCHNGMLSWEQNFKLGDATETVCRPGCRSSQHSPKWILGGYPGTRNGYKGNGGMGEQRGTKRDKGRWEIKGHGSIPALLFSHFQPCSWDRRCQICQVLNFDVFTCRRST